MGSGLKKKKWEVDMGSYIYNTKEQEAMMWCVKNNIRISPKAKSTTQWSLVIDLNGSLNESPETYPKTTIWKKLFEFYKYYYDKYNKK